MPKPKRLAKRMFNRAGTFLPNKKMEGEACEFVKVNVGLPVPKNHPYFRGQVCPLSFPLVAWPSDEKAGSLEPAFPKYRLS